jgi:copper resistance protein B
MKRFVTMILLFLLPYGALAADDDAHGPSQHDSSAGHQQMQDETGKSDEPERSNEHSNGFTPKDFGVPPIHDNEMFVTFLADRFEYRTGEGDENLLWDVQTWIGTDYHRLYLESEGEYQIDPEEVEEAEIELLYGFNISVYWDLRIGLRHDFEPGPSRTFAAFGIQGLAPYWFEMEATAYVSDEGDISANIEAEYDILLSQQLILQPRIETNIALQEVEQNGVGQGFNDIELGLRLRYEIRREFAPYIGISWNRKLGETADLAESEGEDTNITSFVAGIRFWF